MLNTIESDEKYYEKKITRDDIINDLRKGLVSETSVYYSYSILEEKPDLDPEIVI